AEAEQFVQEGPEEDPADRQPDRGEDTPRRGRGGHGAGTGRRVVAAGGGRDRPNLGGLLRHRTHPFVGGRWWWLQSTPAPPGPPGTPVRGSGAEGHRS